MLKKIGTKQIVPLIIARRATKVYEGSAVLLIAICLITVFTSLKDDGKAKYNKDEFLIILTAAAIIGCTYLIGMLPALGLFVVLWLKLVEHTPWPTTLIILAIVAALVIGVFVMWLGVRFPTGAIYDMIVNH